MIQFYRWDELMMETSSANLWEREYANEGIPSSVRVEPSGALVRFLEKRIKPNASHGKALDIGCGTGRNALYLAERGYSVVAVDFVQEQIERLKNEASRRGLRDKITAFAADIRKPWPAADAEIDLAVDAFCFKHQIPTPDVEFYVRELTRVCKPRALFMLSLAGRNDGYYKQFPVNDQTGPGQIIVDPKNGIASRLYDTQEISRLFSKRFELMDVTTKEMTNMMHGSPYDRETHVFCWARRPI